MVDDQDSSYKLAREEYRQLVNAYGEALAARSPLTVELFDQATSAWERLRNFKREESELDFDSHLVLAFSHAIQARDATEAKRLYEAMSADYRETADGLEALRPGSTKIWLGR